MKGMSFVLILCVLIALPLAAGGGQQGASNKVVDSAAIVTPPGQLPIVREPITLTVGIQQDPNVHDYTTNYLTKYLEEKTGIKLKFQMFANAAADANTQFELMVSSNEKLPDIMINAFFPDWSNYGSNGIFIDMAPLYEKYAYFLNQRLDKVSPEARERIRIASTGADGKRYAWVRYAEQTNVSFRAHNFINQVWLDKLGLKIPTTTEELYNTLVAFRDRDPNGNGQKDEIPYIGAPVFGGEPLAFLINAFVYYPWRDFNNGYLNVTNGKLWTPWTTEEYREALRYINRLYSEGLIAPATFTITQSELSTLLSYQKGDTNKVGFFAASHNIVLLPETPAIYDYSYQPSLTGPKGVNYYPRVFPEAIPTIFITKDCAYPEAAFRWLDFITDKETTSVARYGEKDVDWRWARPEENAVSYINRIPAHIVEINPLWARSHNKHWNATFAQMHIESENSLMAVWHGGVNWNELRMKMSENCFVNDGKDASEKVDIIRYTKEEEDSIREIRATITAYREECLALFCTGAMSLDRDWNNYLTELNRMGLEKYLQVTQTAYTRTIGK